MQIKREDLEAAVKAGVLNPLELEDLLAFLAARGQGAARVVPRFSGIHVLYYLGGMLAISAISLFTNIAVESMGMGALLILCLLYAFVAVRLAARMEASGHPVPAGIFATLALALTPLAVYALQHVLGFWEDGSHAQHYRDYHRYIDWRWLVMELATIAAGVAMLRRFRYPFLVMPIAVTLWYMGMDIVPALILQGGGGEGWLDGAAYALRKKVSLAFGALMLLGAFWTDLRTRHEKNHNDYAFWLYLFGLLTFCGALAMLGNGRLPGKLVYLALNVGLVLIGAVLARRVFAVFGGIGIALVLGDLSWNLFKDSLLFVLVLSLLGFALIGAGLWWSRHEEAIAIRLRAMLPNDLQEMIAARHA
jgi:hypothetical protein